MLFNLVVKDRVDREDVDVVRPDRVERLLRLELDRQVEEPPELGRVGDGEGQVVVSCESEITYFKDTTTTTILRTIY